ncbi:hypothetical protein Mucpa_2563 [Mucilaginibacter paludis DSM 18603]|uniref:Uncharacterized protein n=1 Tax=Mucilaginibacter paludis DSM 18603 TaxID=714943 RepID=H1Y221_9SPHI|nr:hypothetical protein Mucpa_2563 [Mucilaginibacter paludis DSM 18603]
MALTRSNKQWIWAIILVALTTVLIDFLVNH